MAELPPALWAPGLSNEPRGIRIPPQTFHTPIKRKHHDRSPDSTEQESSSDSESEPEVQVIAQSSKGKAKATKLPKHHGKLSAISRPDVHSKRQSRGSNGQVGRPSKDPYRCDFSAHVFIEIANPPKLQRGRTHKTDKYVPQGPTTEGPFTFTHSMDWKSFMSQVADLAGLEKENVALTQMTWHFQGRTKSLPLGNIGGFTAMVTQIRALKIGASAIVLLGIPVPPAKPSRGGRNAPPSRAAVGEDAYASNATGSDDGSGGPEGMWGRKVRAAAVACVTFFKLWPVLMLHVTAVTVTV